jgi:hypothetical protein
VVVGFGFTQLSQADPVFFVDNPSGNSTDWTNSVTGLGASINANINFNAHPLGVLDDTFYSTSDGVTFSQSGFVGDVTAGQGPAQANTSGSQPGEGLNVASNHLRMGLMSPDANTSILTISFNAPVLGVGFFSIDFFDTGATITIDAYDAINGTGGLLGSADSVNQNFQQNNLYFLGVSDVDNVIRSLVITLNNKSGIGDVIGIDDIRFAPVPEPSTLAIDIKPGSDPNAINPRSKGVIPVAILTTEDFDAPVNVDPSTVEFGPSGAGIGHRSVHFEDVDGDGDLDLVLHFPTQRTGIACGDTKASLTGETFDGTPIEGSDSIVTVGCKSKGDKKGKNKSK